MKTRLLWHLWIDLAQPAFYVSLETSVGFVMVSLAKIWLHCREVFVI